MKIVEQFETIQGEGKYVGVPSYFIRTTGCNLRCEWPNPDGTTTRCDTPYTSFNPEKGQDLDIDKVFETLRLSKIEHIVITGGEPTMQNDLKGAAELFDKRGYHVTLETNGTKFIKDLPAFMSISPKLSSSYAQTNEREKGLHIRNNNFMDTIVDYMLHNDYQLKFVGNDSKDLEQILDIQRILHVPKHKIYIMPQGITTEQFKDREQMLVKFCIEHGFNYSPRLHIDIWGNKRGT